MRTARIGWRGASANLSGARDKPQVTEEVQAEIQVRSSRVKAGDLSDLEEILVSQAIALNELTNQFLCKGNGGLFDPIVLQAAPDHPKTMLNLALKAQNQCRATIQTINDLKNPKKTTFIKNQLNNVQMELEQRISA